jgi:hypothetical protein
MGQRADRTVDNQREKLPSSVYDIKPSLVRNDLGIRSDSPPAILTELL